MFFARKFLFFNFWLLSSFYIFLVFFLNNQILNFDYFNTALIFMGFYLLLKSICYFSDSSFFFGGILFLFGLFLNLDINDYAIIVYPFIINCVSFFTFIIFDSNLMKFVFYCISIINIINIFLYFMLHF